VSPRFRAVAAALVVLGGCTADPAEVARAERKALSSVAVVGAPFADVGPALAAKGYDCRMSRGNFTAESGTSSSAPAFMRCNAQTRPVRRCSIGTQIVVVPKAGVIEQVHFFAGNACMRAK
jgi:hypothetical protein